MSRGNNKKSSNTNIIWLVLALVALGTSMGAVIASRLVTYRTSSATALDSSVSANSASPVSINNSQSFCQYNALDSVTASLYQVRAINAIVNDPLPTLSNLSTTINSDLIASFSPAPFPQISDRARGAKIPIIMYHDITATKDVDWDVTPQELEKHFQTLQEGGYTPISMDRLVSHLRTGAQLPEKPVLLTFDDNYVGQYQYAFPLLKKYNYPAVWSIHTRFVGTGGQKPKATWDNLREMQTSGLVTIASHTVNHLNLKDLSDAVIEKEVTESKKVLEKELGINIDYFTYPEGDFTNVAKEKIKKAGYKAALAMSLDPRQERSANESEDLLTIMRFGQSRFNEAIEQASSGTSGNQLSLLPTVSNGSINFTTPVEKRKVTVDGLPLTLVYGGRAVTAHADKRAQVAEILPLIPNAIAAVDGGFFSLERIDGNTMIGPVMSQFSSNAGIFNVGNKGENPLLNGRPLVLISPTTIKFIPFNAAKHNSLEAVRSELSDVTDAFVAAGWLVRDGKPQSAESFGKLYGFDASRDRAFWGIDRSGRPVIGVTMEMIDSVGLGKILAKAGLQDAVMLDSGASAALAYRGKSVMAYEPRPVPHVVALLPPDPVPTETAEKPNCPVSLNR
ncbi:polysaccharide deacetylase family protein [Pseudanabaena sp. FACHB-1998]|uniref:polysaccharide deacetylase family protein n=1 Tax=Pseudanabaena sp. FACHB-1998 TaxID=2692858 RepID=UPI00167FFE35|nr:polysaccharide deacetylase family protein [Pseudanabaena sp. FACHB-1998]MBD2176391.1 polysaccharide deacetylase family protein [Pseudanabaena sp. FACHB-1998]